MCSPCALEAQITGITCNGSQWQRIAPRRGKMYAYAAPFVRRALLNK